jgi:hypothetical protein
VVDEGTQIVVGGKPGGAFRPSSGVAGMNPLCRFGTEGKPLWGVVQEDGRKESMADVVFTSSRKEVIHKSYVKARRVKKSKPRVTIGRDVGMQEI